MAKRTAMKRKKDAKVFSNTANRGKKINVNPFTPRGGIRM